MMSSKNPQADKEVDLIIGFIGLTLCAHMVIFSDFFNLKSNIRKQPQVDLGDDVRVLSGLHHPIGGG